MKTFKSISYDGLFKPYYTKICEQMKKYEKKRNHTRIILALFATIIAIIFLASCARNKPKLVFKSSEEALNCYHDYLSELRAKKSADADELVLAINNWTELRDSVLSCISKDSSYYAHTALSMKYYNIHDSIKTVTE